MIYQLEVENFYSIKDRQVLDLTNGAKVKESEGVLAPIYTNAMKTAPRVVAVYGPNASGKSTVLRAVSFLGWFVAESFNWPNGRTLPFNRFLSSETIKAPAKLVVHFSSNANLLDAESTESCPYIYTVKLGVEISSAHEPARNIDKVMYESLYYRPPSSVRAVKIFERLEDGTVKFGTLMKAAKKLIDTGATIRSDASLISSLAQYGDPFAAAMQDIGRSIFSNINMVKDIDSQQSVISAYANNNALLAALNTEIQRFDLGISEMAIVTYGEQEIVVLTHDALDLRMPYTLESHGTKTFINIFPKLYKALTYGGIAVIDELDCAIHPSILPEILRWFYDDGRNPHGAQLWLSAHSVWLMDDLIREQIVLCEKSPHASTDIYRLTDVEGARRDDNIVVKYMSGRYGAVPVIG